LSHQEVPALARPLDGLTVLVVEDHDDARELFSTILTVHGAIVAAAASAAEALAALAQAAFDVVVSDINMPGETGYDLIRRIRQLPPDRGRDVPVVAATALSGIRDRDELFAAGFRAHLCKPVDAAELVVVVAHLAGRKS
jgi:CheY-like chemotaxis protein